MLLPMRITAFQRAATDWAPRLGTLLLYAAIGIEAVVLATWMPETLRAWLSPGRTGYGDFDLFFISARDLTLNGLYSPALQVLLHPLTYLGMHAAYTIYIAANIAAWLGVAWLAQRSVTSLPARVAVALGVLALPQSHWGLRLAHFSELLAFATLAGLLLAPRRPVAAGLLLSVLALKPQYLPVPLLFLLWTRNWRALATTMLVLSLGGLAGIAATGPATAVTSLSAYAGRFVTVGRDLLGGGPGLLAPSQESWQYSWHGFLVSAGITPHPVLIADLMLLSLGATLVAWWKCSPSVARCVTVLAMLLLAPYSTFYNWGIIAAAAALLLRSDLRPRWLGGALIAGVALAAAATQAATPFPIPDDPTRAAHTYGLYWLPPATLLAICTLAVFGRPQTARAAARIASTISPTPHRPPLRPLRPLRMCGELAVVAMALALGATIAARAVHTGPFERAPLFARSEVLNALPADFPLPDDARVRDAGAGHTLPYSIEWESEARTSEVAGIMRRALDDGSWEVVEASAGADGIVLRTARAGDASTAPAIADVRIRDSGDGSRIELEFAPVPATDVPNYERWLESRGIIVRYLDPEAEP